MSKAPVPKGLSECVGSFPRHIVVRIPAFAAAYQLQIIMISQLFTKRMDKSRIGDDKKQHLAMYLNP
jgi:hypothetical protein